MTRRQATIGGLVVIALALAATWQAFHTARLAREAEALALCDGAVGRDERSLDDAFTRLGLRTFTEGTFLVTYATQSSYFRSLSCAIVFDTTRHARSAVVVRFLRQEVWLPGVNVPIWENVIWPALVRASEPLTP